MIRRRTSHRARTEFTVAWPVQGVACFRSEESELVLSDVYWQWIFEALEQAGEGATQSSFVRSVDEAFKDPAHLVQTIAVSSALIEELRDIRPTMAPSFDLLEPSEGSLVPTAERVLAEFIRVASEAVDAGTIQMEIE